MKFKSRSFYWRDHHLTCTLFSGRNLSAMVQSSATVLLTCGMMHVAPGRLIVHFRSTRSRAWLSAPGLRGLHLLHHHTPRGPLQRSCRVRPSTLSGRNAPSARSVSTREVLAKVQEQGKGVIKWTVVFWLAVGCWASITFGTESMARERDRPTPPDWTEWTRIYAREAAAGEYAEGSESGVVHWPKVGATWRRVLERLEDPKVDGAGLRSQMSEEGDIHVLGVGKTGFDASEKSEAWRRGYHQALMGAARAAEHLDTWVRDKTRRSVFPPEVVVGPSNPDPLPIPENAVTPPVEEDCEPAFESPHHYYLKILTTQGFTSRQRLDAALAYADWIRYKGLSQSTADVYAWALDIVEAGLQPRPSPIDRGTGILCSEAAEISSNAILTATALATHHAQLGDFAAAIPIFLSVLRAQQALPPPDPAAIRASRAADNSGLYGLIMGYFDPPYPPAPPTGDEPATRTPAAVCAEAGTMAHIGEILFASSPLPPVARRSSSSSSLSSRWWWPWSTSASLSSPEPLPIHTKGLAWTRDAVDLAQETLQAINPSGAASVAAVGDGLRPAGPYGSGSPSLSRVKLRPEQEEAQARCAECLVAGVRNWRVMVQQLADWEAEARRAQMRAQGREKADMRERLFFEKDRDGGEPVKGVWEAEVKRVVRREMEIRRLLRQEGLKKYL